MRKQRRPKQENQSTKGTKDEAQNANSSYHSRRRCEHFTGVERDPPQNHTPTIEGVWQVSRVGVNCNDPNQELGPPFPAIMTFHRDGTVTGAAKSPVTGPFDTPEYGSWQREPGSQNYSFREVAYRYDGGTAPLSAHLSSPPTWNSPAPTASSIAPRSRSSTLMGT